jgi:hypothetical protein
MVRIESGGRLRVESSIQGVGTTKFYAPRTLRYQSHRRTRTKPAGARAGAGAYPNEYSYRRRTAGRALYPHPVGSKASDIAAPFTRTGN